MAYRQTWYTIYKKKTIDVLQQQLGDERGRRELGNEFKLQVERLRQHLPKSLKNIEKQAYQITTGIRPDYTSDEEIFNEYVEDRFAGMAESYDEIATYLQQLKRGEITYNKFIELIEEFRETDLEYLGRYE